jgi:hypothetical protein
MAPIHVKLKYASRIRRVPFDNLPNWLDISTKVNNLYELPLKNIAVTYIDSEDDEITISSDSELQDFYQSSHQGGNIKFSVHDLCRVGPSSSLGEFTPRSPVLHYPFPVAAFPPKTFAFPESSKPPRKRVRLEVPQTPLIGTRQHHLEVRTLFSPSIQPFCAHSSIVSPPRLPRQQFEPSMTAALQPFAQYITDLADGKFDSYFHSIEPGTLATKSDIKLPNRPILLLHSLGKYADDPRLARLFRSDTVFVF